MSTRNPKAIDVNKYIPKRVIPFVRLFFFLETISEPIIAYGRPDSEKRMIVYPNEDMFNPKSLENASRSVARKPGNNNAAKRYFDFKTESIR